MSSSKEQALIKEKEAHIEAQFNREDYFNNYLKETLNNFSHRYFDNAFPAEVLATSPLTIRVYAIEQGIKEAIKNKNPELRAGITELVKRVSKAMGPTIVRELRLTFLSRSPGKGGQYIASARISFGHPEHDFKPGSYIEKAINQTFEDDLNLRNTLAKYLEEVSEIF